MASGIGLTARKRGCWLRRSRAMLACWAIAGICWQRSHAGGNQSFAMQQTITRTGCLVYRANGYLFQADNTAEVLQLIGGPLAENVGNRVAVTGAVGVIRRRSVLHL